MHDKFVLNPDHCELSDARLGRHTVPRNTTRWLRPELPANTDQVLFHCPAAASREAPLPARPGTTSHRALLHASHRGLTPIPVPN
jgi:hypothetical protein